MEDITQFNSKLMSRTRTAGDGMECDVNVGETSQKIFEKPTKKISRETLVPGRLIQIFPSNSIKSEKKTLNIYSKDPKFVPYEPYPGAVKPIVPKTMTKGMKRSKNNMDINTLITQMSQMDTKLCEFKPRTKQSSIGDKVTDDSKRANIENVEMQRKVDSLQSENDLLKDQLKQQAQVNKELKTMLVASMGEDLETQVQSLNEDKKHLANALLNSAQHLSTHQEQTEWLAGQCEVWRSKFLASSLMVEELANWKRVLNERTDNLQQTIKQLLDERCRARNMMIRTYKNLYSIHEKWLQSIAISEYTDENSIHSRPIGNLNMTTTLPPTSNILDLASITMKLSENISSSVEKQDVSHLDTLSSATEAERTAEHIMATPLEVKKVSEVPVNALVHHAYSSSGTSPRPIAACLHCNGKVQLL